MAELDQQTLMPFSTPWLRTLVTVAWGITVIAFLAVTAYYIVCHHVEPLSRDQWHMYQALFEHGLLDTSLGTVSGHRHILAFLLYTIDMDLFDGRNRFLTSVNWFLNGALILLLCTQAWRLPLSRLARTLLCGWILVLLTWLLNIALLGWGFNGINNYLSIVPLAYAVFLLHRAVYTQHHANLALALLLGVLATLSFANGILVWPTAMLCLYLWRAPARFYYWTLAVTLIAIAAYALLPGAEAAGQTLKWPGWSLLRFPVQVMGGPVYHLLRSWHIADESLLLQIATGFGSLVTLSALLQVMSLLRTRQPLNTFQSLCVAVMCLGAGSTVMLTMSRLDEFLDLTVDRFQIFALLVWIGTAGLSITTARPTSVRRWEILFLVFPLCAFPSQLDWGARLAEYRSRVDMSLLAYQVHLPLQDDAEKALHWNWENKLPAFFTVLEYLRQEHKNVFFAGHADWLDKPYALNTGLPACNITTERTTTVFADALLNISDRVTLAALPYTQPYRINSTHPAQPVGRRWFLTVHEQAWDSGLVLDAQQVVRGLLQPVHNSLLPRASGVRRETYNAYGVARSPGNQYTLVLLHAQTPVCQSDP